MRHPSSGLERKPLPVMLTNPLYSDVVDGPLYDRIEESKNDKSCVPRQSSAGSWHKDMSSTPSPTKDNYSDNIEKDTKIISSETSNEHNLIFGTTEGSYMVMQAAPAAGSCK